MIAICVIITVLIGGQLLVLRPLWLEKLDIETTLELQNATAKELAVIQRMSLVKRTQRDQTVRDVSGLRKLLLDSTTRSGLSVNRIQNNKNSVTLYFDQTAPELFFLWVRTVEAELGLKPNKFSVRRGRSSQVRVSIEFAGNAL